MNHEDYRELLSALLDGELDDAARDDALAHLDGCAACRGYFAELTALHDFFAEPDDVEPPADFAAGVLERLHGEGAKKAPAQRLAPQGAPERRGLAARRTPWRAWTAMAACAAVVVLTAAVLPSLRMGSAAGGSADATMSAASSAAESYAVTDADAGGGAPPLEAELYAARGTGVPEESAITAPAAPPPPEESAGDEAQQKYAVTAPAAPMLPEEPAEYGGNERMAALEAAEPEESDAVSPALTLSGEGAAEWLDENGVPADGGAWYEVDAALLRELPEGLELTGIEAPDAAGHVRVALAAETEAQP